MSIKSLMNYTFVSKYARWDEQKQRRETWGESVDRVRQMMIDKYADPADPNSITDSKEHIEIVKLIDQAYDDMKKKKVLGHKERCNLVVLLYLNIMLGCIIVFHRTLIDQDSSKNVCTYCCVVVVLDSLYKNIT